MAVRLYGFGINDYPDRDNDLRGCVNDIILVRNMARSILGLQNDFIHLRTDRRATIAAYREKMLHAVMHSKAGDVVIFWNSSHGTQVRDRNGDEISDGKDEAIVPYDFETEGLLLDDEIHHWLNKFNHEVLVILALDCCFSGSAARSFAGSVQIAEGREAKLSTAKFNRSLILPVDMLARESEADLPVRGQGEGPIAHRAKALEYCEVANVQDGFRSLPATFKRSVVLSASSDKQTSADAFIRDANGRRGAFHGAFTWSLCRALQESGGDITYGQLIDESTAWLTANGFSQKPELDCAEEMKTKRWGKF